MSDKQLKPFKRKIKDFECDYCGEILCRRRGNELIGAGFIVELKKTHNVFCAKCRQNTLFKISRKSTREKILDLEPELH